MLAAAARAAPAGRRAAPAGRSLVSAARLGAARRGAACRAGSKPVEAPADAYAALAGRSVLRATDGAAVELTSLWSAERGVAVVAFLRSFG